MEYTKSRMSGMVSDYQKMYDAIKNWNEESPPTKRLEDETFYNEPGHYIYGMGWALGDMGFHGWVGDTGTPCVYPCYIEQGMKDVNYCKSLSCYDCRREFWMQEVE